MPQKRIMLYLISYDVREDKPRNTIRKILEGYGRRVQYSVFECWLSGRQFEQLIARLEPHLNPESDSLRCYRLCAGCAEEVLLIGYGEYTWDEDAWII